MPLLKAELAKKRKKRYLPFLCTSKAAALATMAESLILAHSQGRLVYLFILVKA